MKVNLLIFLLLATPYYNQLISYTRRYNGKKFPLTINTASRVLIADSKFINTFTLVDGWTTDAGNHSFNYEQTSNFIPFNSGYCLLQTTINSFTIHTLTASYANTMINNPSGYIHTFSNEQLSLFTYDSFGIVGFINSDFLTFIKFNTINETDFKQYTTKTLGRNVHCISFTNCFACFYTDPVGTCLLSTFDTNLNPVTNERDLLNEGCSSSRGGKMLSEGNKFFICSLKNDNSINCLALTNHSGTPIVDKNSLLILSGCSSSFIIFGLAAYKTHYIVYCSNGSNMMMQEISFTLEFLNPLIQFTETNSSNIILPSVNKLNASNGVLIYSDSTNAIVYTMLISPTCVSFTATGFTNSLLDVNFPSKINNSGYTGIKISLKTMPSSGDFVSMPGENPTVVDTAYELLSYQAIGSPGTVTAHFIGINTSQFISPVCTVTIIIKRCYISCFTCNSGGTNTAHDCSIYEADFFPIQGITGNCVNDLTAPPNYYFDGTIYKPCHVSCAKCTGGAINNCLSCAPGYHWANSSKTTCLNAPPVEHYLDTDTDTYLHCYISCGSCSKSGTINEHNCTSCKPPSSYPIDNFPVNCVDDTTKPLNYYFDANRYKECYISCATCTGAGTSTVMKCSSCKTGHFPLDTNSALCYNDETKPSDTYLDLGSGQYKKCHSTCATCSAGLTGANENCLSCLMNLYLHNSNCVTICPIPTYGIDNKCVETCPNYSVPNTNTHKCDICSLNLGSNGCLYKGKCVNCKPPGTYIANAYYNILDDCYPSCHDCLTKGTKEEMKCTQCITNYYQLEDKPNQCHNVVPDGYFNPITPTSPLQYLKCFDYCRTCSDKGNLVLQNCLSCIKGYEINPKKISNCVKSCDPSVSYWYTDDINEFHCTKGKVCPDNYPFYVPSSNECALSCHKCLGCTIIPYYTYGNTCVPVCPDNSIADSHLLKCIDLTDQNILMSTLTRYILTNPSNKVLVGDNIQFQFCNTTTIGWADCIDSANKMSLSIVDFKKCFDSLVVGHSLPSTNYFYIGIFNIMTEYSTPQVEYVVYDALGGKLDLSYCSNDWVIIKKRIDIALEPPLLLVDKINKEYGYNILDSNSIFYHNICSTYTSEYQTDVILEDRAKYIYPHSPLCEESCYYGTLTYDLQDSRIECKCKTKDSTDVTRKDNFTSAEIQNKTLDQPVQFFKCYKLVFSIEIFSNNIGNYSMIVFFMLQFIFCIWFFAEGKKPLLSFMHSLLIQSNSSSNVNAEVPTKPSPPSKTVNEVLKDIKKEKEKKKDQQRKMCDEYAKVFMINQNYVEKDDSANIDIENLPSDNNSESNNRGKGKKNAYYDDDNHTQTKNTFSNIQKYSQNQYEADIKKAELTEYQLFTEKIRKYDQKTFFFIYCYNLKKRHRLLSLVLLKNVYEIVPYKLTMLIFSITFDMFFNVLLCYNGYISTLFVNQTNINVELCFGFGLCSAICSYFIMRLLEYIMEYRHQFRKLANEQRKDKEYYREMHKRVRNLNIKFAFFYFIVLLVQVFMWYFITAFCATFTNTQYTWGIGIVVSLFFSWTVPFLLYLVFTAILYKGIKRKLM